MKKEYLLAIVILAVIGAAAFTLTGRGETPVAPDIPDNFQAVEENTVIYKDSGYAPSMLTVQAGSTVTFFNQSDLPMWTASDPHPVHSDYAVFDHRKGVGRNETYAFTFEGPGTYDYHNHLSPQHTGTILVE